MSESIFKTIFVVVFAMVIIVIATALVVLVMDFSAFKADFHKAYFPDYMYNNPMGMGYPQNAYGNPMNLGGQENKVDEEFLKMANGQWASDASASTSYNNGYGQAWAAKNATGAPDTYFYGDNGTAWAPQNITASTETLTLTFDKAVHANGVNIKESYGSGAITKVEIGQGENLHSVWEGVDPTRGLNYLRVTFEKTNYLVNTIKITLDGNKKSPNEWMEIDAVQLVGE